MSKKFVKSADLDVQDIVDPDEAPYDSDLFLALGSGTEGVYARRVKNGMFVLRGVNQYITPATARHLGTLFRLPKPLIPSTPGSVIVLDDGRVCFYGQGLMNDMEPWFVPARNKQDFDWCTQGELQGLANEVGWTRLVKAEDE